jgi:hypothetical protein
VKVTSYVRDRTSTTPHRLVIYPYEQHAERLRARHHPLPGDTGPWAIARDRSAPYYRGLRQTPGQRLGRVNQGDRC